MKKKHRRFSLNPFIDVLFLLTIFTTVILILVMAMINPITKKETANTKAEFQIILEWNNKSNDDVDVWVEDPAGNVLSYQNKSVGLMHLDRDDLGTVNDSVIMGGQQYTVDINREVVAIRGIIPGEFIINVHMYRKTEKEPTSIKVEVQRVNPYFLYHSSSFKMSFEGEEVTVIRIVIDKDGDLIKKYRLKKRLFNGEKNGDV